MNDKRAEVMGAYIGKPSMNSCQCNGPNPSGQRREVLASAKAGGKGVL
jgi:hypothetical protein